jgi:class 3 adenylate cyclase/predicted ATPase
MDVGAWLRGLGLEQYEAAFRDNAIDDSILPSLTADDLKDLGVAIVGHRRKLLDAAAALRANADGKAAASFGLTGANVSETAERRQVTVMFSDLVGSTALSANLDPEDLREIIAAYQKCVAETVRRFGGFVAKYLGDGVLVYFGYPQAHEDDAEQAVRAGLELIRAVAELKTHARLQTRVGIATGMVVVGDLIGSGAAQERGIVGETPNLAARLQDTAEPNTVIVAESTRKLIGNLFDLQELSARELKGIAGPARAWAALRASPVESRFEALHAANMTALVGREEETELLLRRWAKAKSEQGQVVLISGEAGIGKSRLTAALLERLGREPYRRLRYFCSPQHTDSAFYPIISRIERAAGLSREDSVAAKLDKLDAALALTATPLEDAALIAEMLSLPNDGRYPTLTLSPQLRRQRTIAALMAQMEQLAQQTPLLMVVEDAHWGDPTSLEVFDQAVDRVPAMRALLLMTFRPEFEAPWIGRPYVTSLSINRLTERDASAMIDRVVGNKLIPAGIRNDIIERTDGIPLFVEEMTKAVLESESEGVAQRAAAAVPFPALAVPATLHASLMARLDRLGPAKEIAQIGAAIGREFSHALLAAVVRKPEAELNAALDRVVAAGLLFRQGEASRPTYLFKHALVQDAAYGTLLREPRRALHARIAETIEKQFPEIAEAQPATLARHCAEAGLFEKAAGLWGKAAQRSLARSALVEAVEQLTRALAQIEALPPTPARRREQIKLQAALISPLLHVKGYASPETTAAAERARLLIEQAEALGESPEDPLLLFSALYGSWVSTYVSFDGDLLCDLAAQFLALAEKQPTRAPLMIGHRLVGVSLLNAGAIAESRPHLDRAIALYNPEEHRPLAAAFGADPRVAALSFRGPALWMLGYPDAARADAAYAIADARETGQAASLLNALAVASIPYIFCGDYAKVTAIFDELFDLAEEKGTFFWKYGVMLRRGELSSLMGQASNAVQTITAGIQAFRSTGASIFVPWWLAHLAVSNAELGEFDEARRCLDEAMSTVERTREKWCEADVNRIAGEVALKSSEPKQAQAYFERALELARKQQAKSWELRAATSLARLWRDQGRRAQARDLLAPVYGWFTEGFDTRDLREAKALLDTLPA